MVAFSGLEEDYATKKAHLTQPLDNLSKKMFLSKKFFLYASYYSGLNQLFQKWQKKMHGPSIRVLLYHRIEDIPKWGGVLEVSTQHFAKQMEYVSKNHQVISFADAIRMKEEGTGIKDSLIITFDDGFKDQVTNALPILKKYNLKACFFVTTGMIGHIPRPGAPAGEHWSSPGMSCDEVRNLRDQGFEIGAHTRTHPNLARIPLETARQEILGSKQQLEEMLGQNIEYFSYPYGKRHLHFNEAIKGIVAEGFKVCCTTDRAPSGFQKLELLEIPRMSVHNWWSPFYFAKELEGTFEWISIFARRLENWRKSLGYAIA